MKRILLVEDEKDLRDIVRQLLESEGHTVDTAIDGIDALLKLNTTKYSLMITDIDMPRMNGLELTKQVKTQYEELPVIMASGRYKESINDTIVAQCLYFEKPYDFDELFEAIEIILHPKGGLKNE